MTSASVQIRTTHPFGYRFGRWAELVGFAWHEALDRPGRPCYRVRFPDGTEDLWPIRDEMDPYEFRSSRVACEFCPGDGLGDHVVDCAKRETHPLDPRIAVPTDFLPGGDGYPRDKDPVSGEWIR